MKTLRYLLMSLAIVSVLSISAQEPAQDWGKEPESRMQSTSAMAGSGSTLPSAAVTGVSTTYGSNNAPSGPRKIGGGNSGGGDGPTNPDDIWSTPLGDAMLLLALLAITYGAGCMVYKRRKRSANE